jgi:hypothetical protein
MLIAIVIAAVLIGSTATAAVSGAAGPSRPVRPPHAPTGDAARSSRPNRTDWEKIENAARLRTMALAPHRTSRFRAFAAYLGLRELASIHRIAPGRCAIAVTYLHNNLLDLGNAYPGENWTPLRRAVAKEPSIHSCAPRPPRPRFGLGNPSRWNIR